jgi:predicted MFS family arabinose efflux permease
MIAVLSGSNFVIGMGAFIVIGVLEPMAGGLGIGAARAGWVMTVYALSYAVLSPVLVALTGRVGRRRVMAFGMALFGLAMVGAALAQSEAGVLLARAVAAAGAGLFTPVAAAVAAGLSAPDRRARALAAVFFGLTLAQVAGVPAGSWLAYTFGWRSAFAVVALLALPSVMLVWRAVPAGLSFQAATLTDLGAVLRTGTLILAIGFTTSFMAAIYAVYTYLSPLLSQGMGYGRDGITLSLLVFGIGAVGGNLMGGALADRIGAVRTLAILAVAQAVLMPGFAFLPLPDAGLLALMLVWSLFGWSFLSGQQLRIIGLAPQSAGVVLALNAAAIYVGAAIGSAIGGAVLDRAGIGLLGWTGGALALLALAHLLVSRRLSGDGW